MIILLRTSPLSSTKSTPDLITSPVTAWRLLRTPACQGTPAQLEYRMGESAHIGWVSMRLGLTKHVAIHAAYSYNRNQMRGQSSFVCLSYFGGAKGTDCPALSTHSCLALDAVHYGMDKYRIGISHITSESHSESYIGTDPVNRLESKEKKQKRCAIKFSLEHRRKKQ